MTRSHLLFAYGTLRTGQRNHHFVREAECLGLARTLRPYPLYLDRVPYVLEAPGPGPVLGEVFVLTPADLARVDRLEDHPRDYRRKLEPVVLARGGTAAAWLYFHPRPRGRLLPGGDFLLA